MIVIPVIEDPLRHQVRPDHGVLVGVAGERRHGGPQPEGFAEDLIDVGQALHLLVGGQQRGVGAENPIDLLLSAGDHFGMLDQKADGEGEQSAGGFVTSNQEGLTLGHNVVIAQLLAGPLVHPGQHGAEQILVIFDVPGCADARR